MRYWLAVGEPLFSVPRMRLRNKEARLRARAEEYVDTNIRRFHGVREEHLYQQNKRTRVETMLAERREVFAVVEGRGGWRWGASSARVPRWRPLLRRKLRNYLCERNRITKWW